jgi:hypothetical protein
MVMNAQDKRILELTEQNAMLRHERESLRYPARLELANEVNRTLQSDNRVLRADLADTRAKLKEMEVSRDHYRLVNRYLVETIARMEKQLTIRVEIHHGPDDGGAEPTIALMEEKRPAERAEGVCFWYGETNADTSSAFCSPVCETASHREACGLKTPMAYPFPRKGCNCTSCMTERNNGAVDLAY